MVWWYIVFFIVAYVIATSNIPKAENAQPAGFGDLKVPTAQEGLSIPVLFGTRYIASPNVVWSGDLATVAIKSSGGKK